MQAAVVIGLGLVLLVWWFVTTRRHVDRRAGSTAEWSGDDSQRPDLWTSSAACVHCGARGGLLELVDDRVEFECLSCGRRSVRETRG